MVKVPNGEGVFFKNPWDEGEVLRKAREGDVQARELILREYASLVGLCIQSYHLVGGDRDDLYQEGMIGLLNAMEDYRGDRKASFRTFARLCIKRQIFSAVRKASRQKHSPLNQYVSFYNPTEEEQTTLADVLPGDRLREPESMLLYRETLGHFKETVDRDLSELERNVLRLHMQGIGQLHISETLKKDPKSVDNALQRGKKKLARRFPGNYS